MGYRNVVMIGLAFVVSIIGSATARTPSGVTVDCAAGESLAQAVRKVGPRTTIQVSGTCAETLIITTDDLTIEGQEGAVIDGQGSTASVVDIDGARRTTIRNLTVQGGNHGILVQRGASANLEMVTAQDNTFDGIRGVGNVRVDVNTCTLLRNGDDGAELTAASSGTFINCTAQKNGDDGVTAFRGASLTLVGTTTITQNGDDGLNITTGSDCTFAGTMTLDQNGDDGLSLSLNSSCLLSGVTLTANHSGTAEPAGGGIRVIDGSVLTSIRASSIEATDNPGDGFNVARNAILSATGGTTLRAERNGDNGLIAIYGALVQITETSSTTSTDNATMDINIASDSICIGCPQ